MVKKCEVCGNNVGVLDQKIKTKDKKYVCENCYDKVFENYNILDLTNWEQAHNFDDFMGLFNDGITIDLKKENKKGKESSKKERANKEAIMLEENQVKREAFKEKRKDEKAERQIKKDEIRKQKEIKKDHIKSTKEKFKNHDALLFDRLSFDPVDKEIMQPKTFTKPFEVIPYSDIVGYTPIERGHSKNKKHGITRAVVGGVLAGGVGSIVGAGTGGKQFEYTDKLGVNIALKDGSFLEAFFIKQETKEGMMVKAAYDNFYRICSLLDGIIAENGHKTSQKVEMTNPNDSLAKQIRDLKELVDDEIITQEEFEAKKKQLLEA